MKKNKFILLCMVISTFLIVAVAVFATTKIQTKLVNSYTAFGTIVSKTLAIEGAEISKAGSSRDVITTLKNHSKSILNSNTDISYIEFKDKNDKIVYSSKRRQFSNRFCKK